MKKLNKDKLIEISIIGVLTIFAIAIGFKLYGITVLKNQDYHIKVITESDVLIDKIEIEDNENEDIEKIEEENLNITIETVENNEMNAAKDQTDEGKTVVIVNEEKPVIPETPAVENVEDLTDNSKEPEYEEIPTVEENQNVEGNVVQVETTTEDKKYIPEGVNTTLVPDSENPFFKLGPPPSGIIEGVDASEYYEDDRIPGQGDKF